MNLLDPGRVLVGLTRDIRRIAEAVTVLPGKFDETRGEIAGVRESVSPLAAELAGIYERVAKMEHEVETMRRGVDAMLEEVAQLQAAVVPISALAGRIPGRGRRRPAAEHDD